MAWLICSVQLDRLISLAVLNILDLLFNNWLVDAYLLPCQPPELYINSLSQTASQLSNHSTWKRCWAPQYSEWYDAISRDNVPATTWCWQCSKRHKCNTKLGWIILFFAYSVTDCSHLLSADDCCRHHWLCEGCKASHRCSRVQCLPQKSTNQGLFCFQRNYHWFSFLFFSFLFFFVVKLSDAVILNAWWCVFFF